MNVVIAVVAASESELNTRIEGTCSLVWLIIFNMKNLLRSKRAC